MGDLHRRKHDVDVIERVLGGVQETSGDADGSTRLISVEVPRGGSTRSTLELTVGLDSDASRSYPSPPSPRSGEAYSSRRSRDER